MSWAFLNTRIETLTKSSQEGFDLEVEIAKAKDAIETTHQCQSFSTLENECSKSDLRKDGSEVDPVDPHPSSSSPQVDPFAPSEDVS